MANALILTEKPEADVLPISAGASALLQGHYAPPPKDEDGKRWVRTSAIVQAGADELYSLWHDLERVPEWQEEITSVSRTGTKTSHWIMKHGEKTIQWDGEILADEPGKRIAWQSTGDVDEAGEVIFENAPGGRGTMVTVLMQFKLGVISSALATLTGRNPKQAVIENLRHFKALAETGEIPRSHTDPHGDRGIIGSAKQSLYGESLPVPPEK